MSLVNCLSQISTYCEKEIVLGNGLRNKVTLLIYCQDIELFSSISYVTDNTLLNSFFIRRFFWHKSWNMRCMRHTGR
jgi:hypothetical protein